MKSYTRICLYWVSVLQLYCAQGWDWEFSSALEVSQFYLTFKYFLTCNVLHLPVPPNVVWWEFICKVVKIWEGSLDSIPSPSPSVKIQIMGEKVCFRCKGKTTNFWKQKVWWHHPAMLCLITSIKFPTIIWRWRWWDQIQSIFLNLFYFISSVFSFYHLFVFSWLEILQETIKMVTLPKKGCL